MTGEPTTRGADERQLFSLEPPDFVLPKAPIPAELPATQPPALPIASPRTPVQQALRERVKFTTRSVQAALMLEWDRGALFLLIPPALACGVVVYLALPVEPPLWALAAVVFALAAGCYAARLRPILNLMMALLLLVVLGAAFACIETLRASTKMLGSDITTRLTGRVVEIDHLANGRIRMTMEVLETERPKLRFSPERVRVSASAVPDSIRAGSVIKGLVKLFPPSGPLRPGSYDFSFESYFDGIGANGFFFRKPELVTAGEPLGLATSLTAAVDNFRNRVAARIRDRIGGAEGEIAAALIVGVRAGIPEPVNEALRRTGLAHILSISGLHMALVAASIMGVLRLGFAAFPDFASRHAVKKMAAAIALLVVAGYLFVSGAEVAARRSFIMLAVMLVAVLFDRAALTMRNLAIAAIVTIAISPHEVIGPSFQMSFAATAALIGGYAAWTQWSQNRPNVSNHDQSLTRWLFGKAAYLLAGIAATALIAGLATTIYGAWHFQRVSPLSLIANLAVTPIISVIMWCGVLASVAMPFGLDGPFLAVMGEGLTAMLAISSWLSQRSPLDAVGVIPLASVILLTIALLVATLASTWLRCLALPFAACGLWLLVDRPLPDILISKDGRLVGVRQPDGVLAINRARPNGFTVEDWQRALIATKLVKPTIEKANSRSETEGVTESLTKPVGQGGQEVSQIAGEEDLPAAAASTSSAGFVCAKTVCILQHETGGLIVHTEKAESVADFCSSADLIITADATARKRCGAGEAFVITARDLARRGAASVDLTPEAVGGATIKVRYALTQPYRPWHENRTFSRAARGIVPYVPKKRVTAPAGSIGETPPATGDTKQTVLPIEPAQPTSNSELSGRAH